MNKIWRQLLGTPEPVVKTKKERRINISVIGFTKDGYVVCCKLIPKEKVEETIKLIWDITEVDIINIVYLNNKTKVIHRKL